MHKPQCGNIRPTFVPKASDTCVRDFDHPGDHEGCTGTRWPQPRIVTAEELSAMLAASKADPSGFKVHDRRNW